MTGNEDRKLRNWMRSSKPPAATLHREASTRRSDPSPRLIDYEKWMKKPLSRTSRALVLLQSMIRRREEGHS